jgi:hypothetical protein
MSRSFTIVSIEKVGESKLSYKDGRFLSNTPSGAARKMFSKAHSHCRNKCNSFKITLRETTQNSLKKEFKYRVSRVKQETEVEYNGETIIHLFTTKVKSLN